MQVPFLTFLTPGTSFLEDGFFPGPAGGWFQGDSLHLLCTLFPLLLYQLHLTSSGIRSWQLGTAGLVLPSSLIILARSSGQLQAVSTSALLHPAF